MSKVDLEVTIEDAFIIGQLEGQKKLINELVKTFCTDDKIEKDFFVAFLNMKLNMISDVHEFTKVLAQGLREPKQ